MIFKGKVIVEKSYDPFFKIEFSYDMENKIIEKGYAEIVRKAPKSEITYDQSTQDKLKSMDKCKLELELLNLVIDYMFNKRINRISSDQSIRI